MLFHLTCAKCLDNVVLTHAALSTRLSVLHGVMLIESLKECRPVGSEELLKETFDLNGPLGALHFCDIK